MSRSKEPDKRRYYVYEWFIVDTGEVFYVGKGTRERYRTRRRENVFFMRILESHNCNSRIVRGGLTEKEALDYERELIARYRKAGNRLTNVQDGGENPPTLYGDDSPSKRPEVRARIATAHKRRYELDPELREGVSLRQKQFYDTEHGREVASKRARTVMARKDTRGRISEKNKEYWGKPERRKAVSKFMKQLYADEKMREMVTGANNGNARRVRMLNEKGEILSEYPTLMEAERRTGISHKNISKALRGHRKTAGGFKWEFADDVVREYKQRKPYGADVNRNRKQVLQYSLDGKLIAEYASVEDATRMNGFHTHTNITANLRGRTKSAYGFVWKYKE